MKAFALALLLFSLSAAAQQPALPPTGHPGLDKYRSSRLAIYADDYGELSRYQAANSGLQPPGAAEGRVIFFGDSITDAWKLEDFFPGKSYINRGIGGQTTSQMLVRFRQDVIDLQPMVVVILAGTNDIAGNTGPISNENIEANYATLAELAGAHRIRVIFSSILPIHNYTPESQELFAQRSPERIQVLNRWLRDYCADSDLIYLDYFSPMVDEKGFLKRDLANDGLHPNQAGYATMAPLAQKAIDKALAATFRARP